jgi:hypothetical protein
LATSLETRRRFLKMKLSHPRSSRHTLRDRDRSLLLTSKLLRALRPRQLLQLKSLTSPLLMKRLP